MPTTFWKPGSKLSPVTSAVNTNGRVKKDRKYLRTFGKTSGVFLGIIVVLGVIIFFLFVRPALAMMGTVNALKADKDALRKALVTRDVDIMQKTLDKTAGDLNQLKTDRDKNFGWLKNFGMTKAYYSDSDHFINSGLYVIDAAKDAVNLVTPFADAAGLKGTLPDKKNAADTGLADAFSKWISLMPQVADQMDPVLAKLDKAGEELKPVDPNRYPESIARFPIRSNIEAAQTTLSSISEYAPDIKKALQVLPGALGVGSGEKRYMIIMQNDKELRATGGFWTNYATFRMLNGMIVNYYVESKDMYSIDETLNQIDAYYTFPTAPAAYQKYLKVERLYARDTNISPDFPTNLDANNKQSFMYFYKLAMPLYNSGLKPVDGIIAIDTQVIKELLEVTGPVTVNGITYTPDNVVLELEKTASLELREQAGRKKVLGDLMKGMMQNLLQSDKNMWPTLVEKGFDLAARKHILAYSFDPEAQKLLEEYNYAGRIIDPVDGDFSYVVSTNLGGDKTNWFVKKNIDHTLTKEGNRYVDTVKISYTYPQPAAEFAPFVKRFRDWVRVYAPLNSQIINVTGSEDGNGTDQERNKTYFTGYIELGPGETKEMTFKYYLPDNVIKNGIYNLYLEKQPGVNGETHTVTVNGKTDTIVLEKDAKITKKL